MRNAIKTHQLFDQHFALQEIVLINHSNGQDKFSTSSAAETLLKSCSVLHFNSQVKNIHFQGKVYILTLYNVILTSKEINMYNIYYTCIYIRDFQKIYNLGKESFRKKKCSYIYICYARSTDLRYLPMQYVSISSAAINGYYGE